MKTLELSHDWRSGRAFVGDGVDDDAGAAALFARDYADEEDLRRATLLEEALARSEVRVEAAPLVGMPDVLALYVQPENEGEPALFACNVVSQVRLARMLEEQSVVMENMTLQVAPVNRLTRDSIVDAFRTWTDRNFIARPSNVVLDVLSSALSR